MTSNKPELTDKESSLKQDNLEKKGIESIDPKTSAYSPDIPAFGWSSYAERVNGRFAMVGFLAILLIEVLSKSSFLDWAGLLS